MILIKGLGIGGAETLIAEAAPLWDQDEFHYRVAYMLPWKDQLVTAISDAGVEVTSLDWKRPPGFTAMVRWRRLLRSWQPDVIHSHLPAAGLFARITAPTRSHIYTEHNLVTSYRLPTRLLNRATYGVNNAVAAVSEAVGERLSGYPGPRPRVVPNGVSVSVSDEEVVRARAELDLPAGDRLVVHVGNIRPHKGHETLIDAATIVLQRVPHVTVVSVGAEKFSGDLARLRARARDRGIDARMRFLGRRQDARALIAAADVVVNPADSEGLPVALLEALALSRPVVATAVGGVPSVVRHETTGLLVPPGSPDALAEALMRALTSPLAVEWGKEGARLVEREFGLETMVRAYESLYREVVSG
ncbi:MAG TPA: glycosyltransferase [Acidimicrobiia bacterium]